MLAILTFRFSNENSNKVQNEYKNLIDELVSLIAQLTDDLVIKFISQENGKILEQPGSDLESIEIIFKES